MGGRRVTMHDVREILRLALEVGLSNRAIASNIGISHSTVKDILDRFRLSGLSWPLSDSVDAQALEAALYVLPMGRPSEKPEPDYAYLQRELRHKGVTLQLLWSEYKEQFPDGYQYSKFCDRYRAWAKKTDISMRQTHLAGEKCFIDYAGPTLKIVDPDTGEVLPGHLFVAVLGASNFTYVEVHRAQDSAAFIGGHVRAFAYFGGVPALLVPDNLKAAVTKADRYEPLLNRSYQEMATHYGTVVLPARPFRPRDKAKVEIGVQIAERWILAVLRKRTFFSIAEANTAVREYLELLNDHPFQKLEGNRRSLFAATDQHALKPLPQEPYEFAIWRLARVHIDCHVEYEHCLYSVPHALVRQEVDLRTAERIITIYHKGAEVARHTRCTHPGERRTVVEHLPKSHQKHLEWTPDRLVNWGRSIGTNTGILVERILQDKPHPEMGYRSCLGILNLSKQYTAQRLESAAQRALGLRSPTYGSVKSILQKGLDRLPYAPVDEEVTPLQHRNIRGSQYYQKHPLH